MRLMIFASELAALCDMNRYADRDDAWTKCLQRNGLDVDQARLETVLTAEKVQRSILEKHASVCDALVASSECPTSSPLLPQDKVERAVVLEAVNKARGSNAEPTVLRKLSAETPERGLHKTDKFQSKWLMNVGKTHVYLGGKLDAQAVDGELIEIKSRQRRLFGAVPLYEKVQVHAYMHIGGKNTIRVVEAFQGITRDDVVHFDETLWDTICDTLRSEIMTRIH